MTGQLGGNGDERHVQGPRLDSPRPGSLRLVECLLCGARWVNDTGVCERCGGHDWKDVTFSEGGTHFPPDAAWLAAMIRNWLEQDDALKEAGSIIFQAPDDPKSIWIIQRGGEHLMVQVSDAEVVIR